MTDQSDNGKGSKRRESVTDEDAENQFLSVDEKLNLETGVISWSDLVRYFARGVVIKVVEGRDLVEVGTVLATDNKEQLESWLSDKSVARASDDDARDWAAREPDFWCLVAAPWVLVQENVKQTTVH